MNIFPFNVVLAILHSKYITTHSWVNQILRVFASMGRKIDVNNILFERVCLLIERVQETTSRKGPSKSYLNMKYNETDLQQLWNMYLRTQLYSMVFSLFRQRFCSFTTNVADLFYITIHISWMWKNAKIHCLKIIYFVKSP